LAKEHGTIHGEMQIMRAVHRLSVKRTFGDLACVQVPHLPGRFFHDGFNEYGFDIQIARIFRRDFAHGAGERDIPCGHLVHIVRDFSLWEADW